MPMTTMQVRMQIVDPVQSQSSDLSVATMVLIRHILQRITHVMQCAVPAQKFHITDALTHGLWSAPSTPSTTSTRVLRAHDTLLLQLRLQAHLQRTAFFLTISMSFIVLSSKYECGRLDKDAIHLSLRCTRLAP